jgi:hypothetical protein
MDGILYRRFGKIIKISRQSSVTSSKHRSNLCSNS